MKKFKNVQIGDLGVDYNDELVTITKKGTAKELLKFNDDTGCLEIMVSSGEIPEDQECVEVDNSVYFVYGYEGVVVE